MILQRKIRFNGEKRQKYGEKKTEIGRKRRKYGEKDGNAEKKTEIWRRCPYYGKTEFYNIDTWLGWGPVQASVGIFGLI